MMYNARMMIGLLISAVNAQYNIDEFLSVVIAFIRAYPITIDENNHFA